MSPAGATNGRILVVDDEDIVVSLVRDALEEEGYEVHTAQSGPEALKVITAHPIDLLITDIRMPQMTGTELANRAKESNAELVVIFMTGYANLNSAKDAIKQGAIDYILKPFELSEMRQAVSNAMAKRQEAKAKSPEAQLEQLSDFSHMLVTTADRDSLVTVALEFALMHCQSEKGAVLWWDENSGRMQMVVFTESRSQVFPVKKDLGELIGKIDWNSFVKPVLLCAGGDDAVTPVVSAARPEGAQGAEWLSADYEMLVVPIARPVKSYGLMIIGVGENSRITNSSTQKFLAISASQLAMSLENLDLLEEARAAYARLKELQDETIQLEKMATRGEMSAEIGHELNNFVGVVAGNLSLLEFQLNKQNFADLEKYVRAMQDTIANIKKFTANLMELTPISSKKEVIQFDRLLAEVIDYLKPQRRFRDVAIICDNTDISIPFEADSVHVQQLLYNLFNNAADATSNRAKREIAVSTQRCDEHNKFVFSISDTGSGIDPDYLTKAFREKFTTKPGGHGFGLLVCSRIIESHGGKVDISSIPDEGTTIRVEFPLAPAPAMASTSV